MPSVPIRTLVGRSEDLLEVHDVERAAELVADLAEDADVLEAECPVQREARGSSRAECARSSSRLLHACPRNKPATDQMAKPTRIAPLVRFTHLRCVRVMRVRNAPTAPLKISHHATDPTNTPATSAGVDAA